MKQKGNLVWFEIPVEDLSRAINFYTNVFGLKIERKKLTDFEFGVFDAAQTGLAGTLVKRPDLNPGEGPQLFFYVNDIHAALERMKACGGDLLKGKTLIRQTAEDGSMIIPKTMIDNEIGYYAEIKDCEGNRIALHSNS